MTPAEPHAMHRWLQTLVGDWAVSCEAPPGAPPGTPMPDWTETVRSLNGLWVVAEGRGEMPGGGTATTVMTLGYDPQRERFVGTWVGSMMTHLWVYDGTLDGSGRTLTLDTVGPDMAGQGKLVRYQDIVTVEDGDHRVLRSQALGDDGVWKPVVTMRYRRTA
ncbi:DUF1579 domain-containing protein [Azospirillum sp. ST 5-10]|uniref:DUF1579 domain-containing protein n=1 Tax=unclassified Azospirillum TaxID=2630922 RepID=UPI003F49BBD3